jgi:hypothetical protein
LAGGRVLWPRLVALGLITGALAAAVQWGLSAMFVLAATAVITAAIGLIEHATHRHHLVPNA